MTALFNSSAYYPEAPKQLQLDKLLRKSRH